MGKSSINGPFSMAMLNSPGIPLLWWVLVPVLCLIDWSELVRCSPRIPVAVASYHIVATKDQL